MKRKQIHHWIKLAVLYLTMLAILHLMYVLFSQFSEVGTGTIGKIFILIVAVFILSILVLVTISFDKRSEKEAIKKKKWWYAPLIGFTLFILVNLPYFIPSLQGFLDYRIDYYLKWPYHLLLVYIIFSTFAIETYYTLMPPLKDSEDNSLNEDNKIFHYVRSTLFGSIVYIYWMDVPGEKYPENDIVHTFQREYDMSDVKIKFYREGLLVYVPFFFRLVRIGRRRFKKEGDTFSFAIKLWSPFSSWRVKRYLKKYMIVVWIEKFMFRVLHFPSLEISTYSEEAKEGYDLLFPESKTLTFLKGKHINFVHSQKTISYLQEILDLFPEQREREFGEKKVCALPCEEGQEFFSYNELRNYVHDREFVNEFVAVLLERTTLSTDDDLYKNYFYFSQTNPDVASPPTIKDYLYVLKDGESIFLVLYFDTYYIQLFEFDDYVKYPKTNSNLL